MNDDNKLKTASALSSLWDGEPIRRVRQGDGSLVLFGRRVTMHLMVQPGVAASLLSDDLLRDQGTLSRLLVTFPATTAGSRLWRETKPEAETAIKRYEARLLNMMEAPIPLAEGKANELSPRTLTLTADARRIWIGFLDNVESQVGPGGPLAPIRGLANKLAEHAARLGATLALVGNVDASTLSGQHIADGIALVQHYAAEALRLQAVGLADPIITKAETLLAWLQDWPEPLIGLTDIYRLGPNAIREAKLARQLVSILQEHGWLVAVDGGAVVRGTHRREAWRIIKEASR